MFYWSEHLNIIGCGAYIQSNPVSPDHGHRRSEQHKGESEQAPNRLSEGLNFEEMDGDEAAYVNYDRESHEGDESNDLPKQEFLPQRIHRRRKALA
ncbi:hypothetical protein SDC9_141970 [bioreactor metagenome]|uniref:Uncharacterized protein n=1 Tax=bioreactor metagenome TaxID=1076179 RepID=A0A645E2M1_9ZZZZ